MERIAIIGLGLLGGSLGLALRQSGLRDVEIAGTARTRGTLQTAKRIGAIDVDAPTPAVAVRDARLVIIASPIMAIPEIFDDIAPQLVEGAVVTDVASTKAQVMRWATERLPEHADFVGGHPMAGKETAGIGAADAELFREKPWVVAPSVRASDAAVRTVVGLAQSVGAKPMFMDPDEHDSYAAAISHLPLVLASALFSVVAGSNAWPEMAGLASSGFKDTTRLASGSPEMAHDIMRTNRDNVLHWLDRFAGELQRFRETIAGADDAELLELFARQQVERDNYITSGPPSRMEKPEVERVSLSDMLVGGIVSSYMKRHEERLREMESRERDRR